MSETGCLLLLAAAVVAAMATLVVIIQADKPHERCVEERRVEMIVGMEPRRCPALDWWREPNGHTETDHG